MSPLECLDWVARLIALATFLQTLEHIQIYRVSVQIWDWKILREEHSEPGRTILSFFLKPSHFRVLLWLRVASCLSLAWHPNLVALSFLLFSTYLISLRWRGTFNGGSDTMTFQVLGALFVGHLFPTVALVQLAVLWYLAIQSVLSYFVAGWCKLAHAEWRNGRALSDFLALQHMSLPYPKYLAWVMIAFECAFPLALLGHTFTFFFLSLALFFHLLNAKFLGLNRFLFAWMATYPAILYCAA